jgi:hypothetical protein
MRRHQWRAFIVYRLDEEEAAKMFAGPPGPPRQFVGAAPVDPSRATLTADMVDQEVSTVGCYVCEQSWQHARHTPCPGEPVGYTPAGEPIYQSAKGKR